MAEQRLDASNKLALYLVLVPYLIERQQVPLAEAAQHFGVGETEMQQLVEKLTVIGLPGEDDFFQMPNDLFDINWDLLDDAGIIQITHHPALQRPPRLTSREAAALIAGLELIAAAPGAVETETLRELRAKLARGSSGAGSGIAIDPGSNLPEREVLGQAIRERRDVTFAYQALDASPTHRTVTPHRLLFDDGQWYLQGWCRLRGADRTFNLERMTDLEVGATASESREEHPISLHVSEADDAAQTVTLRVLPGALERLGDYRRDAESEIDAATGEHIVRVRVASPQSFKRIVARNAAFVRVIAPEAAVTATQNWARAALAAYNA